MATIRQLPSEKWHAQVRIKGYPPKSLTFRTKAQAKRWAVHTGDKMRSGTFRDTAAADGKQWAMNKSALP